MNYLLLSAIIVSVVVLPAKHSNAASHAGHVDNAVIKRIGTAITKATPLLSNTRIRQLLRASAIIDVTKKKMDAVDDGELDPEIKPFLLHYRLTSDTDTALELPAAAKRQLPDYMQDTSGLRYDKTEHPLHVAVAAGDYKQAVLLLTTGGDDINTPDPTGRVPLHIAAEVGDATMVALLLCSGAQINAKVKRAWRYKNDAKRKKKKIDNDALRGMTAAHLAISGKHLEVIALLLLEGADFDIDHNEAATPVHMAAAQDFIDALVMLNLAGVATDITGDNGYTPLDAALLSNSAAAIDFLTLPHGGEQVHNQTIRRALLQAQNVDQLNLLMQRGAHFVDGYNEAVVKYARLGRADLVIHVIDKLSGSPNAKDDRGMHALRHALHSGDAATITALLERGANPMASKKKKGKTHFVKARELGLVNLFIPHMLTLWEKGELPEDITRTIDKHLHR